MKRAPAYAVDPCAGRKPDQQPRRPAGCREVSASDFGNCRWPPVACAHAASCGEAQLAVSLGRGDVGIRRRPRAVLRARDLVARGRHAGRRGHDPRAGDRRTGRSPAGSAGADRCSRSSTAGRGSGSGRRYGSSATGPTSSPCTPIRRPRATARRDDPRIGHRVRAGRPGRGARRPRRPRIQTVRVDSDGALVPTRFSTSTCSDELALLVYPVSSRWPPWCTRPAAAAPRQHRGLRRRCCLAPLDLRLDVKTALAIHAPQVRSSERPASRRDHWAMGRPSCAGCQPADLPLLWPARRASPPTPPGVRTRSGPCSA